jgi:valyl-tRNA synthetase
VLVRELENLLRLAHPIMPFVTEELWQTVAPLVGKGGPNTSICNQPYPQYDPYLLFSDADRDMRLLKSVVTSVRTLRSEMKISPADRVPLVVEVVNPEATVFQSLAPYVVALAKISNLQLMTALPQSTAPVQIVDGFRLMLEIKVDLAQEKVRLEKEIARLEGEIAKSNAKLVNPAFADKAPPAVVAQERNRLADFVAAFEKNKTLLQKLH